MTSTLRASARRAPAAEIIKAGVAAYKAGQYTQALWHFQQVVNGGETISDKSGLYYNIGSCLRKLGRNAEAIEAYKTSLAHSAQPSAETRTHKWIAELQASVGFGRIQVGCNVANAAVSVGTRKSTCNQAVDRVGAGTYVVSGKTAAGVSAKAEVTVTADATAKVMLRFGGDIGVNLKALGAVVAVDSEPKGMPPLRINGVEPGQRLVEVRAPQGTASVSVEVKPGELTELTLFDFPALNPEQDAQPDRTWAKVWVGGGTGLMTVGAAYLIVGLADHSDAQALPVTTDAEVLEANRLQDAGTEKINTGWAFAAVGLVGVGIGAWLYQDDADGPRARLDVGATGDGAFVRWRTGW